ncbi:DUF2490 domain-containing protein [Psychroflexus salis]|nr:DUF2490 domain-containing protein [Psychroflexus salis]
MKSFFILILSLFSIFISAQDKEITSNEQFWMGYMTSGKISEKYSLWNDFHYVPNGFFVARTGLTRFFHKNLNLTAGYAYLNVPTINEGVELKRNEHRPWMQMVANHKVSPKLQMINRIRYDMRFRQDFADGELLDSFTFNHRLRMLISMRFPLIGKEFIGGTPFVNLSNEVLVNFGKNVENNYLDQNRTWLTFGLRLDAMSLQVGYMHRFVQLTQNQQFVRNHTLVVWITHNFDFRKKNKINPKEELFYRQP